MHKHVFIDKGKTSESIIKTIQDFSELETCKHFRIPYKNKH